MVAKDEPQTILQLSYNTKYAKKYCEEAIESLINEGKIKRKEVMKNSFVFYLVCEDLPMKEACKEKVFELLKVESEENTFDHAITNLEKLIKEIKLQPSTEDIRKNIA